MNVLDCENIEGAMLSLAEICGISVENIRSVLGNLDLHQFLNEHPNYKGPPESVLFSALEPYMASTPTLDRVHWFHLSRVKDPANFDAGIMPLGTRLPNILAELGEYARLLIPEAEWTAFIAGAKRNGGHSDFLYCMKLHNRQHWGPFGFLVREAAFRYREIGNHDYLSAPEIVEDICRSFEATFGHDLLSVYKRNCQPCIIKFCDDKPYEGVLDAAISYIHAALRNEELSLHTNTCFDGCGQLVEAHRIISITAL